ncbi:MAG: DUF5343 domain-containing protein [Anaerolineae bacterium]|jgi:hypothetical protein
MTTFPYSPTVSEFETLLEAIQKRGVPSGVDDEWLRLAVPQVKSTSYIRNTLVALGFIDEDNVPTELWTGYRSKATSRGVLAKAIRSAYSELYENLPEAHLAGDEELTNFFAVKSGLSAGTVKLMLRAFRILAERADFAPEQAKSESGVTTTASEAPQVPQEAVHTADRPFAASPDSLVTRRGPIELHIDIAIHIPPQASVEQIDQIFESMARHLGTFHSDQK